MTEKQKVALWLRVSTSEQTVENQRLQLNRLANQRGYDVVREYDLSGVSAWQNKLEGYVTQVIADAPEYVFDILIVAALDRLTRAGAGHALLVIKRLEAANIGLLSMREPVIDTGGPYGEMLIAFFAVFANIESQAISERTKAGMERAKERGTKIGRPKGSRNRPKGRRRGAAAR